ncbi:MAG: hypothetical protein K5768_04070 [Firmicutes bacterium]|nr:hypothetical protein [Bacillota bacterium]
MLHIKHYRSNKFKAVDYIVTKQINCMLDPSEMTDEDRREAQLSNLIPMINCFDEEEKHWISIPVQFIIWIRDEEEDYVK